MKTIKYQNLLFDPENIAHISCNPGETVVFESLDAFSGTVKDESQKISDVPVSESNITAGPLFINGAAAGDILVVDILDIETAGKGVVCTCAGWGPLSDDMEERTVFVSRDHHAAYFRDIEIKINPMIGTIGTTPKDPIYCFFPGRHLGNMDCKMIKKGSRVYLPVFVDGALLQMGDLHLAMGDGELCGTGIEIAGRTTVKINVIKESALTARGAVPDWPLVETEDKWYVLTCAKTYEAALKLACVQMQKLIVSAYGIDKTDAFLYISMQADAEINQTCSNPDGCDVTIRLGIPKLPGRNLLI